MQLHHGPIADPLSRYFARKLRREGWPLRTIGRRMGITMQRVHQLLRPGNGRREVCRTV